MPTGRRNKAGPLQARRLFGKAFSQKPFKSSATSDFPGLYLTHLDARTSSAISPEKECPPPFTVKYGITLDKQIITHNVSYSKGCDYFGAKFTYNKCKRGILS